jgi:hypothetical protein
LAQVAQAAQVEMVQPQMVLLVLLEEPQLLVVFCLVLVEVLELAGINVEKFQAEAEAALLALDLVVVQVL